MKKHICTCQTKDYKGIKIKSIIQENDPKNLQLFEAFYVRKHKPTLNSQKELANLQTFCFNDHLGTIF